VNPSTGVLKIGHFDQAVYAGTRVGSTESSDASWRAAKIDRVALWSRAPEQLWPMDNLYTTQIDMWSIGCIFGQLLTGRQLFQGTTGSEFDQAMTIFT
jgi:serine/threonine protein kinase